MARHNNVTMPPRQRKPARSSADAAPPGKAPPAGKAAGKAAKEGAVKGAQVVKTKVRAGANLAAARAGAARSALPPEAIAEIFRRFAARDPDPKGELHYRNPFTLLVAVALSAQATDAGVNKATPALFDAADTPAKMVALGEDRVRELIKTIGLYRTKAKNVVALSRRLVEDFGGEVPRDRAALETLPGVGRKTANVVLNIAFGEPTIAVDTHLFRVANRTGIAPGRNPLQVELGLEAVVPAPYRVHAHHWLILHGRYVCKALRPDCPACLINDICLYEHKTGMDGAGKIKPAKKTKPGRAGSAAA